MATLKKPILLAMVLVAPLIIAAQDAQNLKVEVRLVNVVATVADANGRLVPNLDVADFTIYEDDVPQKIVHFSQDRDVPVSVGLLLDTSASMSGKMRTASEAIDRFIDGIHKDDDMFLMTFANSVSVVQDFTSDRKKISRAISSLPLGPGTRLFDAVQQGLKKIDQGRHDKKAILVLSDGMDAGSRNAKLADVLQSIQGSEVLVYGLGTSASSYADPAEHVPFTLPTPGSSQRGIIRPLPAPGPPRRGGPGLSVGGVNMDTLSQFARNSGGQAFLLSSTIVDTGSSEIHQVLTRIADELRSQYTLGYYPANPDDGRFHTVRVVTRPEYTVRARSGYQGGANSGPANR